MLRLSADPEAAPAATGAAPLASRGSIGSPMSRKPGLASSDAGDVDAPARALSGAGTVAAAGGVGADADADAPGPGVAADGDAADAVDAADAGDADGAEAAGGPDGADVAFEDADALEEAEAFAALGDVIEGAVETEGTVDPPAAPDEATTGAEAAPPAGGRAAAPEAEFVVVDAAPDDGAEARAAADADAGESISAMPAAIAASAPRTVTVRAVLGAVRPVLLTAKGERHRSARGGSGPRARSPASSTASSPGSDSASGGPAGAMLPGGGELAHPKSAIMAARPNIFLGTPVIFSSPPFGTPGRASTR